LAVLKKSSALVREKERRVRPWPDDEEEGKKTMLWEMRGFVRMEKNRVILTWEEGPAIWSIGRLDGRETYIGKKGFQGFATGATER